MNKTLKMLFFLMISLKGMSQINSPVNQISNPNILPPNVSSFQKVNYIPVSNYTGRANIDIPFHEIDLGGLKVPIGLSYNTGGIKVNEVASSVGLGWSLNAGGMISKKVQDVDDFRVGIASFYDWEIHMTYMTSQQGWLSYCTQFPITYGAYLKGDMQPDEFNVSAPNMSFSYIHNRAKLSTGYDEYILSPFEVYGYNQDTQPVNITDTNPNDGKPFILDSDNSYQIYESYGNVITGAWGIEAGLQNSSDYDAEYYLDGGFMAGAGVSGINSITINSIDGYSYIFDKIDASQYVYDRGPDGQSNHTLAHNFSLNSYHLSKITNLKTNKSIDFQYESYTQDFSEIIDNNVVNPFNNNQKGLWIKYPKLNRLKKIIFDKGYINFNYDLSRNDVIGEKALTDIILFDKNNNQIKKMNLNFDYYQSVQSPTVPYSKRLRLKEVSLYGNSQSTSQKYKLTYNSTPLPLRSLAVSDFFGYHNGEANKFTYDFNLKKYITQPPYNISNPDPTLYFTPNKKEYSVFPIWLDVNSIMMPGNYSLLSNLSYCKAGILERIEYPTGGYISLDYELNSFLLGNQEFSGGGLRVVEQKISDGIKVRSLKFLYKNDNDTTSGFIVGFPKFSDFGYVGPKQYPLPSSLTQTQFNNWFQFEKYNSNKANIELTNGSYIGYSQVKVYEEGKGFTIYKYTNPYSHPNERSTPLFAHPSATLPIPCYANTNNYKKIYFDNGKFDFQISNDVYRGKLINESIFNQQGTRLKETQNNFSEIKYKNFLFVNNVSLYEDLQCSYIWGGSGVAQEYVNASQKRYLLTSVVEKEYFQGIEKTKTKNFIYDANYSLVKEETSSDNLNIYRNEYYYPFDASVQNNFGMSTLNLNNRKAERVKTFCFKNNEKLSEEKIIYNSYTQYGYVWPKQVVTYKSGSTNNTDEMKSSEATVRDEFGNICELTDILGNKTSFIWGYNKTEIVAKIENRSYASIPVSLISDIQGTSNTGTESQLETRFAYLRNLISNGIVTTYTYKPLIGVSTIIDQKGDKAIFEYDGFGRLKAVRDKNNNILSENEYHLKPQN